jgi:predicted ATPase/DNA-binding CsgD family transcriptional regulator
VEASSSMIATRLNRRLFRVSRLTQPRLRSGDWPPLAQRPAESQAAGPRAPWLPGLERRHNLPAQPTPLIGRAREEAAAREQLLHPDVRLLTLVGPAGVGKTRLALAVAAAALDAFADGACFVDLTPVSDPDLVASTIAEALGFGPGGDQAALEGLRYALRDQQLLLVLDNLEHLLPAAPQVAELLAACPGLRVLATSRAALRLRWERTCPVAPLGLPDRRRPSTPEGLLAAPAVALFLERARALHPEFQLTEENARAVAEICALLDGLPLAIELVAARSDVLRPQDILPGLREQRLELLTGGAPDLPARHRTLRAALDGSYELLAPEERALFRRLAAFAGGCTLEAVEAVCAGAEYAENGRAEEAASTPLLLSPLEGIAALVGASLLHREEGPGAPPRFRLLQTVREYALERLVDAGELTATRRAHAAYCLRLAERAEAALLGPEQASWLECLEREHDNLRAALRWCLDGGEAEAGLRLGGALWRFWYVRGYFAEGRTWLAELLALPSAPTLAAARASVLEGAGNLAHQQGDYTAAWALHEESLAIWREAGDWPGIAGALNSLGLLARLQGDHARARGLLEEALQFERALGLRAWEARSLNNLGNVLHDVGEHANARALHEASLAISAALGDEWGIATAMCDLGNVLRDEGDDAAARARYEESLARRRTVGDRRGMVMSYVGLGQVACSQREYFAARAHFADGLAIAREVGDRHGIAQALEGLAGLAAALDQPARALCLAGAAAALREAMGAPLSPNGRARFERRLEAARRTLGAEPAAAAHAEGRAMPSDQAVAYALAPEEPGRSVAADRAPGHRSPTGQAVRLTRREQEVATLIARGFTNQQIADELVITPGTAANHVEHILTKLDFRSRTQIAAWAIEHGLVAGATK